MQSPFLSRIDLTLRARSICLPNEMNWSKMGIRFRRFDRLDGSRRLVFDRFDSLDSTGMRSRLGVTFDRIVPM